MIKQMLFWGFIIWSLPIHSQIQESYCYIPSDKDMDKETTLNVDDIFYYDVDIFSQKAFSPSMVSIGNSVLESFFNRL